ncbi:MAG TPA: hypothetical protein VK582_11020 [Pyrinomonadaceae bacterium]|nr:hypothetical protein [Pyrinomonadaceae bacterium]
MKIKLTTLLAIGLFAVCVAVGALSCKPSSTPSTALKSSAINQPSPPPGVFGPPVTPTTQITQANLTTTTPLIPSDLYRTNTSEIAVNDHVQAAKFAWLEFIALVSPVKPNPSAVAGKSQWIRGVPGNSFSSVTGGSSSTYPLVWETYQHRSDARRGGRFQLSCQYRPNWVHGGYNPGQYGGGSREKRDQKACADPRQLEILANLRSGDRLGSTR